MGEDANTNSKFVETASQRVIYTTDFTMTASLNTVFIFQYNELENPDFGYLLCTFGSSFATSTPANSGFGTATAMTQGTIAGLYYQSSASTVGLITSTYSYGVVYALTSVGVFPMSLNSGSGYGVSFVITQNYDRGRTSTSKSQLTYNLIQAGNTSLQGDYYGATLINQPPPASLTKAALAGFVAGSPTEYVQSQVGIDMVTVQKGNDDLNYFTGQAVNPFGQNVFSSQVRSALGATSNQLDCGVNTTNVGLPVFSANLAGMNYYMGNFKQSVNIIFSFGSIVSGGSFNFALFADYQYFNTDTGQMNIVTQQIASTSFQISPITAKGTNFTINLTGYCASPVVPRSTNTNPVPMYYIGSRLCAFLYSNSVPGFISILTSMPAYGVFTTCNTEYSGAVFPDYQYSSVQCVENYVGPLSYKRTCSFRVIPNTASAALLASSLSRPEGPDFNETLADVNYRVLGHAYGFIGNLATFDSYKQTLSDPSRLWKLYMMNPSKHTLSLHSNLHSIPLVEDEESVIQRGAKGLNFKKALHKIAHFSKDVSKGFHIAHEAARDISGMLNDNPEMAASGRAVYSSSGRAVYSSQGRRFAAGGGHKDKNISKTDSIQVPMPNDYIMEEDLVEEIYPNRFCTLVRCQPSANAMTIIMADSTDHFGVRNLRYVLNHLQCVYTFEGLVNLFQDYITFGNPISRRQMADIEEVQTLLNEFAMIASRDKDKYQLAPVNRAMIDQAHKELIIRNASGIPHDACLTSVDPYGAKSRAIHPRVRTHIISPSSTNHISHLLREHPHIYTALTNVVDQTGDLSELHPDDAALLATTLRSDGIRISTRKRKAAGNDDGEIEPDLSGKRGRDGDDDWEDEEDNFFPKASRQDGTFTDQPRTTASPDDSIEDKIAKTVFYALQHHQDKTVNHYTDGSETGVAYCSPSNFTVPNPLTSALFARVQNKGRLCLTPFAQAANFLTLMEGADSQTAEPVSLLVTREMPILPLGALKVEDEYFGFTDVRGMKFFFSRVFRESHEETYEQCKTIFNYFAENYHVGFTYYLTPFVSGTVLAKGSIVGPSFGMAAVSALLGFPSGPLMTGELSYTGTFIPIGGIFPKFVATLGLNGYEGLSASFNNFFYPSQSLVDIQTNVTAPNPSNLEDVKMYKLVVELMIRAQRDSQLGIACYDKEYKVSLHPVRDVKDLIGNFFNGTIVNPSLTPLGKSWANSNLINADVQKTAADIMGQTLGMLGPEVRKEGGEGYRFVKDLEFRTVDSVKNFLLGKDTKSTTYKVAQSILSLLEKATKKVTKDPAMSNPKDVAAPLGASAKTRNVERLATLTKEHSDIIKEWNNNAVVFIMASDDSDFPVTKKAEILPANVTKIGRDYGLGRLKGRTETCIEYGKGGVEVPITFFMPDVRVPAVKPVSKSNSKKNKLAGIQFRSFEY